MSTNHLKSFLSDTSGAVTVDWVVLTAALVGLGLAVISVVSGGLEDLSGDINTQLQQDHVTSGFGVPATGRAIRQAARGLAAARGRRPARAAKSCKGAPTPAPPRTDRRRNTAPPPFFRPIPKRCSAR